MFTWFGTPLRTREQIASTVYQIALDMGLDDLAAVMACMTISTEVGTGEGDQRVWWCPANPLSIVAGSLRFPHDSLSNDNRSMGYYQQQPGPDGALWWGGIADMMGLESSTRSFLSRLPDDYRSAKDAYHAGIYCQRVQGSAFPDRYARAWDEAWEIINRIKGDTVPATFDYGITKVMHGYNPTTGPNCTGNSNGPRAKTLYAVVHTQEGDGTAVSLANYLNSTAGSANAVSYNLTVDAVDTVEVVPVIEGPWAAMDANGIAVHMCFAGSRAAWSKDQWMAKSDMLRRGAKAIAAACRQFSIPAVKVLSTNGWPVTPSGIAAHADFGTRGGGHTDPGAGFPWVEFIDMVRGYMDSAPPTTETPEVPVQPPIANPYAIPRPATTGAQAQQLWEQALIRWDMLGGRTPVEAIAAIGAKLGIDGFKDVR